jgi:hypothetical protein
MFTNNLSLVTIGWVGLAFLELDASYREINRVEIRKSRYPNEENLFMCS